jgi:hypothetical protein
LASLFKAKIILPAYLLDEQLLSGLPLMGDNEDGKQKWLLVILEACFIVSIVVIWYIGRFRTNLTRRPQIIKSALDPASYGEVCYY